MNTRTACVSVVVCLLIFAIYGALLPGASGDEDPFVIIGHVTHDGDALSGVTVEAVNQRTNDVLTDDTDATGFYIITLGGPPHPWEIGDTIVVRASHQPCLQGETSFSITAPAVASQPVWANITLQASLEAAFSFSPDAPRAGQTVNFTDRSTGAVTNHTWDFGDGNRSFVSHPAHIYTQPGNYTVALTVGCDSVSASASHVVAVQPARENNSGNDTDGADTPDGGNDAPGLLFPGILLGGLVTFVMFKRRT